MVQVGRKQKGCREDLRTTYKKKFCALKTLQRSKTFSTKRDNGGIILPHKNKL